MEQKPEKTVFIWIDSLMPSGKHWTVISSGFQTKTEYQQKKTQNKLRFL